MIKPIKLEFLMKKEERIEEFSKRVMVPCPACNNSTFNITITKDIFENVERFPFTIIIMHAAESNEKKEVHTLIAYIDQQLKCRHVERLTGKRVFITPFILYNPNLLYFSCYQNIHKM